jgi:flavin-binding protein dodecin
MREIYDRVLIVGRSRYSPWDASADARHIPRERDEEIFDAVIYAAMLVIKRRRERTERLRCFKADIDYRRTQDALDELAMFEVRDGQIHEVLK